MSAAPTMQAGAPADSKGAMLRVLGDASDSVEALRDLADHHMQAAPALQVMADALALLAWRVEFARGLAAGLPYSLNELALLAAQDVLVPPLGRCAVQPEAGAA